jgi:two-component system, NtrC family, sensor kinase
LSAGVVHEINNPLMGVMLLLQSMMSDKKISRENYKVFAQIEEGLKRIADVVTKLLKFARREKVTLEKVNINNIVRSVLPLVTREFELNGIELSVNYGRDIPFIKASVSEMQQVLINILLNAKDAVLDSESKKINVTTSSKDDAVKLKIRDEGCGIGKPILEKIFEPFFTTKSKKKGVGLGLFIVRTIMDQYGGKIEIHSKEGKGTEVVLSFSVTP